MNGCNGLSPAGLQEEGIDAHKCPDKGLADNGGEGSEGVGGEWIGPGDKNREGMGEITKMKQRMMGILIIIVLVSVGWEARCGGAASEGYRICFRDQIFALHVIDESRYWAVGNMGLILATGDGGKCWRKIDPPTGDTRALNDVTFVDQKGWIVGEGGLILHTEDGGSHWEEQVSNAEASLMAEFFLNEHRGVVVGYEGTVLWTDDGGSRWAATSFAWMEILPESLLDQGIAFLNLYDIFFVDEAHGWIVGDGGGVLFSSDGGKHWRVQRIGSFPPLYSVWFKDDQEGWAAGLGGQLLYTRDGGNSWKEIDIGTEANLFKVTMRDDCGIAVGDVGTVLVTVDGGRKWELEALELRTPLPWFVDAAFTTHNSPVEVICVGQQGCILKWPVEKQEEKLP